MVVLVVRTMRQLFRSANAGTQTAFRTKAISSFCCSAAASILLVISSSAPGYAIPSPDLVVGSISSISQLIALLSAVLGGGAAVVGMRATSDPAVANRTTRMAWRVVWIAAALLAASLAVNYHQYTTQQAERQTRLEAAILRPTITSDGHTLDANLKEPTYGQQLSSPRGIPTSEVERARARKTTGPPRR